MCCSLYWVLFVQSLRVVCRAKAKHVLWFPAAIGNMQFSRRGRWAHPYPGICPTFWQCRDVLPFEQKCSRHWTPLNPGNLGCYKLLFNVCKSLWTFCIPKNGMWFFTWSLELVLPPLVKCDKIAGIWDPIMEQSITCSYLSPSSYFQTWTTNEPHLPEKRWA